MRLVSTVAEVVAVVVDLVKLFNDEVTLQCAGVFLVNNRFEVLESAIREFLEDREVAITVAHYDPVFCERLNELDLSAIWTELHQVNYEVKGELSVEDKSTDKNLVIRDVGLFSKISIHSFLNDKFIIEVRQNICAMIIR